MTTKQTDRVLIKKFGEDGIQLFDEIEAQLKELVIEAAEVPYRGANALEFKTKCATNAVNFAGQCSRIMQAISAVVTENTTYIAQALGGEAITLEPPTIAVEMPSIDADTSVEMAESAPLVTLRGSVQSRCDAVEAAFNENLSNLQALGNEGWIGPEYDETLGEVSRLTTNIVEEVHQTRTVMMTDITQQLQALGME